MSAKPRLLIVEDEDAIRAGLVDVFVYHGYAVDSAADGAEGLARALTGRFDLLLLDVMLPSLSGFEICDRVRAGDREQPIILLTARTSDDDIVTGLKLGADDYVAKPFSVAELVLRVEAVLRRSGAGPGAGDRRCLSLGDAVHVDLLNLCGRRGAADLAFTRREVEILRYLAANGDRPVPRDELLHRVWGYPRNAHVETRTVDIHVAKLRRKIEPDPGAPRFLVTVRGAGYRLRVE